MTSAIPDPFVPSDGRLWVPWTFAQVQAAAEQARTSGQPSYLPAPGFEHLNASRLPGSKMLELNGWSGTELSGGQLINWDHNPHLTPEDWRGTTGTIGRWGEMLRSDPVVMAIWGAWTVGISSTPFTFDPAKDGDESDFLMAAFIRAAYEEHSAVPFRRYLREAAPYALTGCLLHELAWRVDETIGADFGVNGPMLTLATTEPRHPRTIDRWDAYEDETTLAKRWGIKQYPSSNDAPNQGGAWWEADQTGWDGPTIHPDRLLHLTWNEDGTSPEGIGILRACHASYAQRVTYTKLETAGFERGAFGIPVLKVQPNAPRGDDEAAWAAIQGYRVGGRHGMVLPHGYEVEFAKPPFEAAALGDAKRNAGREMCRAAHATHLFTGEDNGTEALIQGQILAFMGFLQTAVNTIADLHSHGPHSHIHRLIDANWPGVRAYPSMVGGRVRMGDIQAQADYIKAGIESKVLTPGVDLEDYFRLVGALPDTPVETREQWEARVKTPAVTPEVVPPAAAPPATASPPAADPPATEGDGDASEANDDQAEEAKEAARQRLSGLGTPETGPGGRPLRPIERSLRLAETKTQMLSGREEMVQVIVDWRESVAEPLAKRLLKETDIKGLRTVQAPATGQLAARLEAVLRRAYRAGGVSVRNEMERLEEDPELKAQVLDGMIDRGEDGEDIGTDVEERAADMEFRGHGHGGLTWGDVAGLVVLAPGPRKGLAKVKKRKAKSPGTSVLDDLDPEGLIQGVAGTTADAVASKVMQTAITEIQSRSIVGGIPPKNKPTIRDNIVRSIFGMSPREDASNAQRDINTTFGLGRAQEGRAQGATHGVFSNLAESQTCDPCAAQDGRVFLISRLDEFATPYSECEGGDRCNCLVFFIIQDDRRAA